MSANIPGGIVALEPQAMEGIAIIGMAGRFPGAPDVASFWQNLLAETDSITHFAAEELASANANDPDYVPARGVLEDIGMFDAEFFSIAPREADLMDPQHRIFLEACSNTLEDAGYVSQTYPGEIGLFAGCSLNTYLLANLSKDREFLDKLTANYQVGEFQIALGNDKDMLTTRAAYKLNLRGPVMSVQAACATSLVAVCQAAQSLMNYQCDMALAGGVSATFPQRRGHLYQEGGMVSRDGVCRPFDAKATGTVFSHGAGVVLLKRLEDAVRDGDHIAAVIRGFAVNNDGSQKAGYMAPGVDGQARVIAAAQTMAGVDADSITYIEAHGTATPLGDPIEVAALTKAFRNSTERKGFCSIGTAKGNVGHLDSAAGVTGLIKTALSLQHRTIPALAHYESANPNIDFAATPFYVTQTATAWTADGPLRAGISAFGVGGVNAHIVVEEAPAMQHGTSVHGPQVICLSARSPSALHSTAANLAAHLASTPNVGLADVAYTLACGRREYAYRAAIVTSDVQTATTALRATSLNSIRAKSSAPKLAMLFSGQGSQFVGMGKELYATESTYRDVIDKCAEAVPPFLGLDLRELMFGNLARVTAEQHATQLKETQYAQPALFATELALAALWKSWGVEPQAVAGHSIGEYVAATLAGVFTAEDAFRLVCMRGKLMQAMHDGAMTSVALPEGALAKYCVPGISIAALNSPRASVLSGPTHRIETVETMLAADEVSFRRLHTSHAFHSEMMKPMLPAFEAEVAKCKLSAPAIPIVSTVTGTWMTDEQATNTRYWADQCLLPVRFSGAVETLLADGVRVLLETGPGEVLTSLAHHQRNSESAFIAVPSMPMPREQDPNRTLHHALADLWSEGVAIHWPNVYQNERRLRVSLPTYPFERNLHWVEPPPATTALIDNKQSNNENSIVSDTLNMTNTELSIAPPAASPSAEARASRLQTVIAQVFTELSGIETSASEYSHPFLELGFDSLFLTQATQSLQRKFGVKLTFRQLMEQYSTIADLAGYLDSVLPAEAFANSPEPTRVNDAPQTVAAIATSTSTVQLTSDQPMERLFAAQMAAMNEMFAAQAATLRANTAAVATVAPAAVQVPVSTKESSSAKKPLNNADVKHGSFRPIQARAQHELDVDQTNYIADLIDKYEAKTPASKKHTQNSRKQLADPRAVAGFRPQWKEMVYPLVTDRARGSKIWDIDGNEYIDIVNGYGCIMFGHSPQFVVDAAKAQLDRGVAIGPQSALAGEVATLICELTGNERVTFCNTGSEAVMAAMRVARTVTGRDKIVYFAGDYHGTFDEVLIRSTPRGSAPVAPGIPQSNTGNIVVLEYGSDESLAYIEQHGEEIAAVLVEPVQTRNPGLQPVEFLRTLRQLTEHAGTAMIIDEVVTGFRVAPGGVQQQFGIRADMCTYGKVIGGGHPIGVLSGKAMYLDALDGGAWQYGDDSGPEVGVTFFAGTFVRHPLALAAARAVLLHLKENGPALQAELNRKTAALAGSLDRLFQERGVPSRVHHFASWFYFTFAHEARLGSLFYYAMRAKGIHIQEGYPCFLTTAHSDADLAAIEQAFRETIIEMQASNVLPRGETIEISAASTTQQAAMHSFALPEAPTRVTLTEPLREVFLAASLCDEANCAFNESLTLRLHGPVRQADLAFALDSVFARHDALRSTVCVDGECLCFAPAFGGATEFIDLRNLTAAAQAAAVTERVALEGKTPFDLHRGPLMRSVCFLLSDADAALVLTGHHIVLDGWSANQLLEEIAKVYSKGAAALLDLAPLLPFSSYAARENQRQSTGEFDDNERFWIAQFAGRSPRLELPVDRPRPASKTYNGASIAGSLSEAQLKSFKQFSAKNGCTFYVTLLSAFQLLLHRLTGQDEVVVGISTAGQALLDGASLVGHCVNFLPMLSHTFEAQTIQQHLHATRSALLDAYDHQEFTYGRLLQKLTLQRDPSRLPLIEVQFNLERVGANVQFAGLETQIVPNAKQFVNTDLFLNVIETDNGLDYTCDFNTDLFDTSTVQRWIGNWAQLLENEIANSAIEAGSVSILTPVERGQLLTQWNNTAVDFGSFEPLHVKFMAHAAKHPNRTAIECGGKVWSYGDLAEFATIVARRLVREGLKPGDLVGICVERSLEMAGSVLAVMLAGGAYVPLDPRHPRERLAMIVADAGISLLLVGRDPSIDTTAKILKVTGPQPQGVEALPTNIAADSLAYVIYTSGSTGIPKGVAIQHAALMNLLQSMQREPGLTTDDVLVAVTTLAFDIATLELLLPLLTGATLIIATDDQVQDGTQLLRLIERSQATVLQATPGAWRILIDAGWDRANNLKVLCGGEALPRDLAEQLLERSSDVWNVYGPTETTIWSSATRVTHGTGPLTIGPPIANTQFYVLDVRLQPAAIGVTGELFIGGDGLARGYWKKPELTEEKFIASPFGSGRIYCTGDLARWSKDGTIELLGRADFQVKVRGYRIELGDIEAALMRHGAVREAVVVQQKSAVSGQSQLVAFVSAINAGIDSCETLTNELHSLLGGVLPEYMVPANIIPVQELPRTPNGKIDRKALPQVSDSDHAASKRKVFVQPKSAEEQKMAAIWSEILGLEAVSVADSIFELDADSLTIFRIAARSQRDGLSITATQIFQHRTIATLCDSLQKKDTTSLAKSTMKVSAASREKYRTGVTTNA